MNITSRKLIAAVVFTTAPVVVCQSSMSLLACLLGVAMSACFFHFGPDWKRGLSEVDGEPTRRASELLEHPSRQTFG